MKLKMKLLLLLLVVAVFVPAYVEPHSHNHHHHGHNHKNDNKHNSHPVTCGSQTKTQELMNKNKEYKVKHELERKRADEYVSMMKQRKDHSFKKDVSGFKKQNKHKHDKNSDNNVQDRRNLFSEYDDEIGNTPVIRIPVVYHVLYSNDNGNLPDAQLQSQVRVLNNDYRGTNTEIENGYVASEFSDRVGDTKLEYYLNQTFRVQISSDEVCNNETLFKRSEFGGSDAIDPKYYLNVWICNITSHGLLGYAYQPCLLDTSSEWMDGLVLGTDNVGSIEDDDGTFWFPEGTTYNLGRTGTHEIGHYLNLDHIWGTADEATCDDTDYVSDTPSSLEANYGCPDNTTNTCVEIDPELQRDLRDMYENFMDYSNDACMFMFTEEQSWRMRSVLSGTGCRKEMYYAGAQLNGNQTLMPSTMRTTEPTFSCSDGCQVLESYLNDGACDCTDCSDEDDYTCDTCTNGCPDRCGDYTDCSGSRSNNNSNDDGSTVFYIILVLVLLIMILVGVYCCAKRRNKNGLNGNNQLNQGLAENDATTNDYARMNGV